MSTITNTALNSRSMSGVITISDGNGTTIENGNITTGDINSASLSTNNINTNLLNVTGKLECNSNGPYNIPTSISSVTGLLIGYGHVTNSGATDFLNFQSTYTSTQGGFRFWNKSATQTLTNMAIIDNTQTYFSSPLTGCLAESPVNPTSVANKTYVDSNFVYKTGSVADTITGVKTFTGTIKSNNYDTNTATATLNIGASVTSGEIKIGRGQTANGVISIGTGFSNIVNYGATSLKLTTIQNGSDFEVRNIVSADPASTNHTLFTNMTTNGKLTIGNLSSILNVAPPTTFSSDITTPNIFCGDALYLNDYQSLPTPTTYSSILVQNTDILNFDANFNNNKFQFKVSSNAVLLLDATNTTIFNNLVCNSQATFNTICPISNTNATLTNHLTTLGFNNGKYIDFTTDQTISGTKRFGTIFTGDHSWATPTFTNRVQSYITGDYLVFMPQFNNNQYAFHCKDSVPNLTTPLIINYLNTTIANNLISNSQATFNNFTPICSVASPSAVNHLTRKDYVDNNFCDLSTTQYIGGQKTFTGDITTQNIRCTTALYFKDLANALSPNTPKIYMYNNVVYFDTNTTYDNDWEFWCGGNPQLLVNQYGTQINNPINAQQNITHQDTQIMNTIKTISGTSATLSFPLEQRWMFTSTGATQIVIDLPELTLSRQSGFAFSLFKTASNTNSVKINRQGTNVIRNYNSITDVTTATILSGTGSTLSIITAEISTGVFAWIVTA